MSGNHEEAWNPPRKAAFDGETFDPTADGARLNAQCRKVYDFMKGGTWHTPEEIESATGIGWASASVRLRDLRKARFGGFQVDRQRKGDAARGLFQYRLRLPAPTQPDLFESIEARQVASAP